MKLGDIIASEERKGADPDLNICGISYDSRQVQPGWLFAAWVGRRWDGHDFMAEAVKRGAVCLLGERRVPGIGVPQLVVSQVRRTLAYAAKRFYSDPAQAMDMVGITGTNGKTTTVCLVASILQAAGRPAAQIGTLGYTYPAQTYAQTYDTPLTTPQSVDVLAFLAECRDAGVQAVAMEVSSMALAQDRVASVAFDVGVFTNLTRDHLDDHGSMEAYFEAKAQLIRTHLKPSGVAVLNLDDAYARRLGTSQSLGFSVRGARHAAVRVTGVTLGRHGLDVQCETPRGPLALTSGLLGRLNVENIAAAVTTALALQIEDEAICAGIAAVRGVPGRLERICLPDPQGCVKPAPTDPYVLVDYAHTPDALTQALAAARELTPHRLICVFGCGGDRDPSKRAPMGHAALEGADWVVLTNDNPRFEDPWRIAEAAEVGLRQAGGQRSGVPRPGTYHVELDRAHAIELAVGAAGPQDTVLIAGRGHESYQIQGDRKLVLDDRHQVRRALGQRHARWHPTP